MNREQMVLKIVDDIKYMLKKMKENYKDNSSWYTFWNFGFLNELTDGEVYRDKLKHLDWIMHKRGIANEHYVSKLLAITKYAGLIDGCVCGCRGNFEFTEITHLFLKRNDDIFLIDTINFYIDELKTYNDTSDYVNLFNYELVNNGDIFYEDEEYVLKCKKMKEKRVYMIVRRNLLFKKFGIFTDFDDELLIKIKTYCYKNKIKFENISLNEQAAVLTKLTLESYE